MINRTKRIALLLAVMMVFGVISSACREIPQDDIETNATSTNQSNQENTENNTNSRIIVYAPVCVIVTVPK